MNAWNLYDSSLTSDVASMSSMQTLCHSDIVPLTGFPPLVEHVAYNRKATFGHIAQHADKVPAHRLELFTWCVRLSRLLVGCWTHWKSLHLHFIHSPTAPAHQALRCQGHASIGCPRNWLCKCQPGRLRNRWLVQLCKDSTHLRAEEWRHKAHSGRYAGVTLLHSPVGFMELMMMMMMMMTRLITLPFSTLTCLGRWCCSDLSRSLTCYKWKETCTSRTCSSHHSHGSSVLFYLVVRFHQPHLTAI